MITVANFVLTVNRVFFLLIKLLCINDLKFLQELMVDIPNICLLPS